MNNVVYLQRKKLLYTDIHGSSMLAPDLTLDTH